MSHRNTKVEAKVLFSYEPTESDEISLIVGDIILVLDQQEDGWWLVKKGDRIGLFPSTHVSIIQVTDAEPKQINRTNLEPLPEGWDSCPDKESGEIYYFNYETGRYQDTIPIEPIISV
jgi:hypothetical protein